MGARTHVTQSPQYDEEVQAENPVRALPLEPPRPARDWPPGPATHWVARPQRCGEWPPRKRRHGVDSWYSDPPQSRTGPTGAVQRQALRTRLEVRIPW